MLKILFGCLVLSTVCGALFVAKGSCPTNEEYLLCGPCSNCSTPNPVNCSTVCSEGCYCMKGYLRNDNGTCVNEEECVTEVFCAENEEFLPCGTACPATCSTPEPVVCGLSCSMGCFCKEGFYRDDVTQKCVTYDMCSPPDTNPCFNANEVFDMCNATCEPTCNDPVPVCNATCSSGCVCASGLLRDHHGDCVSVDKCEVWNGTATGPLASYLNTINKILHLSIG